jgi:exodeoxyribonuclease V beta subunit
VTQLFERPFDLGGDLPGPGITLLEASAGTGKTYALAELVTRFVAEGFAKLSEILAVSFTRAAAGELKERVRSRLVCAEAILAQQGHGREPAPWGTLVAQGSPSLPDRPRQRLSEALANFDAATITTTHGFCYMVLGALGVWGEFSPGAALLEDVTDLVEEVVDDLCARWISSYGDLPFTPREALTIGREAVKNLGAALEPPADESDRSPGGLRRRFAKGVRSEVSRRLIQANLLTYDGMLKRLADALADPQRGEAARQRLAERYRLVLVDEFQDTDLVQWEVVHRAFASGGVRLVLIGDPKQAIYAFRGADVYAYLAAKLATEPANRFTLERNWRCDARLGKALDALFSPLQLGHPEIAYRPVAGSCVHEEPGMTPLTEPLRLRWLDRSIAWPGATFRPDKPIAKPTAERLVALDMAADVSRLLGSGTQIVLRDEGAAKALEAADIAVLVRTNEQAAKVQRALLDARVPAAVSATGSVMSTPAAGDWLCLLDALQQPASRSLAAKAALGDFFGRRAEDLARGDEQFWEAIHTRLHEWAAVLQRAGVAGMFAEACADEALPKRLLAEVQGERRLTDLAHVAELLHAEARRSQLGPAALRTWLARRAEEASSERTETEELCRRLDSDSKAVQILTVHRAKGLEFPVVYCPYLWAAGKRPRKGQPLSFHDQGGKSRKFDPGSDETSYDYHFKLARSEFDGEELRQMYVAATRAKHQLVLWWAPANDCQRSPLGRLLFSPRGADGALGEPRPKEPRDKEIAAALGRVASQAPGLVSVEQMSGSETAQLQAVGTAGSTEALAVEVFDRSLDISWARLSYSSVTAAAHYRPPVGSEPEELGTADEPPGLDEAASALAPTFRTGPIAGEEMSLRSIVSPWAGIRAGAAVGTFVHKVLQLVDFSAPELTNSLSEVVEGCISTYPGDPEDAPAVVAAMEAAISTPLGPLVGGVSLRSIGPSDRLDELGFELPLAGGDSATTKVTAHDLADVLSAHVGRDDPLWPYAGTLRAGLAGATLRGYLNGSLDLVFRANRNQGLSYFVVDYKTNWLAPPGETLSAWHYRPAALEAEMLRAHYVLQALFYLVALHRYLRWRLPAYNPEEHLGGVLYLFVRGMFRPGEKALSGQGWGVFSWRPPSSLVEELSDLLAGRRVPG